MAENVQSFHAPLSAQVRQRAASCCKGMRGNMLDVGCGNGLLFEALEPVLDLRCFGVDRSCELLMDVRGRLKGRAACARGLIDHLPFKNRALDAVACLNTLLNLQSLEAVSLALNEMMRISNGRVVVDIRNGGNPLVRVRYWWHRRTADFATVAYRLGDLHTIFNGGGFEIEQVHAIGSKNRFLAWGFLVVAVRWQ